MVSHFRRHQQLIRGLMSGAAAPDTTAPAAPTKDTPEGQEYAALRVLLHDNLRTLSDIDSIEARNPLKADFAKAFTPWIEGVLAAGKHGKASQDEILTVNMIWAMDYRDIDYTLRLATHALRFNLILPERFKRTVAAFLAEDIADISLADQDAVTHEQLLAVLDLVKAADMHDVVKARLHKAIGRSWMRKAAAFDPTAETARAGGKAAFLTEALHHANRAFKLNPASGVKDDIRQAQRQLTKLAKDADTERPTAAGADGSDADA
jgi:hypothetical protein